jgi:hypothetical protein
MVLGRDLQVAANRDEFTGRPSAPPAEVEPGIVAGRDLVAGGTWLGFNRHGLFVAVTNRRTPVRAPESRSRGLLALEGLRCRTLADVEALIEKRLSERPSAGFNLVAVAGNEGLCLHYDGALRPSRFGAGAHVVSSDRDLDDPAMDEKRLFDALLAKGPPDDAALKGFLASHEGDRPVCKHREGFGTVSSTIYRGGRLLHADGPPCRADFREIHAGTAE